MGRSLLALLAARRSGIFARVGAWDMRGAVDYVTKFSRLRRIIFARIVIRRGPSMRKAFENSFASKTVVAKLIELGYLNDRRILTNKTVRIALERLQTDHCRNATIQARIQRNDGDLQIE
jgi:hypothetical protein